MPDIDVSNARVVHEARSPARQATDANNATIRQAAQQALTINRTYASLASPSPAQTATQIKALTRQQNGIIRLLLGILDGTD